MRPFFPHTMADVVRAVDGGLGLVVADMPDGTLFVLKRSRRPPLQYQLSHYADSQRSRTLQVDTFTERSAALGAFAARIGLDEPVPG